MLPARVEQILLDENATHPLTYNLALTLAPRSRTVLSTPTAPTAHKVHTISILVVIIGLYLDAFAMDNLWFFGFGTRQIYLQVREQRSRCFGQW